MSDPQTPMGYMNPQQQQEQYGQVQSPVAAGYIPTEDEKRVFRECNQESFYYRSLPFSTAAMTATQLLISRGVLTPSPRFGSLPKVAFAGLIGYIIGKISYTKICQEKFKNLENSPLGEALRQGQRHLPQQFVPQNQTEFSDPNQPGAYIPDFQSAIEPRAPSDSESYLKDFSYSGSTSSESEAGSFNRSSTAAARYDTNQQAA
ncbi:OCIA domain-containing protein 1-like [Aplochiton taeniatus]